MSQGYISDAVVSGWLTMIMGSGRYASVHFETPNWGDPGASEAFNAGYSRQPIIWTAESSRVISNAQPITWSALSEMNVAAIGFWTDITGGTMVAYAAALPGEAVYVAEMASLTMPIGELAIAL